MTLITLPKETRGRLTALLAAPRGRAIGVLGLGIAGRAMALLLAHRGAKVLGADAKAQVPAAAELAAAGVELRCGALDAETFSGVEGLAISPGVDTRQAAVQATLARGVPVFGELELCGTLPAKVLAITGTNGKSTTTGLAGALVQACGRRAFVGGNFGEPIAGFVDGGGASDVAVLELSSFQLETAYSFKADVAVMLNITPDHLDRYDSVDDYACTKRRLLENLGPEGTAILSYDDPMVRAMAAHTRARVQWFSTRGACFLGDGAMLVGDAFVGQGVAADLGPIELAHPRLFGRHNRENALASLLAVRALGLADAKQLGAGYAAFAGLEHRLELAGEVGGVRYINDSKATNDDAAAIALAALDRPVVLMLGGRSKHGGYAGVRRESEGKLRAVVAFGEARHEIAAAMGDAARVVVVDTIAEAFGRAVDLAKSGDAVLLSPACSSYDEFKDYTVRGRTFKAWVRALAAGANAFALEDLR